MEKDVVGLEIPMHDVILVENLEGFEKLLENQQGRLFGEFPLPRK